MEIEDIYLGDGVYASFDGYHVVLDLRAQDSTTRIALEPAVLDALTAYVAKIRHAAEASSDGPHGDECRCAECMGVPPPFDEPK